MVDGLDDFCVDGEAVRGEGVVSLRGEGDELALGEGFEDVGDGGAGAVCGAEDLVHVHGGLEEEDDDVGL